VIWKPGEWKWPNRVERHQVTKRGQRSLWHEYKYLAKMNHKTARTDSIREPLVLDIFQIPNVQRKVRCTLINVNKFDQFGVKMRVTKRSVRHQRVIEVLGILRVPFECIELSKLSLQTISLEMGGANENMKTRLDSRVTRFGRLPWNAPVIQTWYWRWS